MIIFYHYIQIANQHYSFNCYFGFVESSLFTWCAVLRFDGFINAIENPGEIFSDGIIPHLDWNNMLECKKTGLTFHGNLAKKELLGDNGNPDEQKINKEYENIISRVKHLVEKLKMIWNSNDTQLYILACNEINHRFDYSDIGKIHNILKSKTKYISLLVIIQREELYKDALLKYYSDKDIIIKKIGKWGPWGNLTVESGDEKGWKKIYKCFKTRYLDQRNKKYKFS